MRPSDYRHCGRQRVCWCSLYKPGGIISTEWNAGRRGEGGVWIN